MQCPRCSGHPLLRKGGGLACGNCDAWYAEHAGILEMLAKESDEVITPFQRVMQTPAVVSIYENIWRRIGYFLASSRSFDKEIDTVLQYAGGRSTGRILDLACGPGIFTRPLARLSDGVVIGLDLSRPMMLRAQKTIRKEGISNIVLIRATAFSMPFIDGALQYINCCGALHLFDNPEMALKEMKRVLDPEGFLCVQTTIRPEHSAGFAFILERFIRFGFFDESGLRDLLARHGFEVLQSERHRISFTFLAKSRNKND